MNKPNSEKKYYPAVDGLRALAVIAVILNHFDKRLLPSGYLGVDIFFVISGYVITSSLYSRQFSSLSALFVSFYARRIKRLVPALVFSIFVTAILIALVNPSPGTSLKTGMFALFGISNIYLFQQATDYFGASVQLNVFMHTWSLGVEEQFYVLFPLAIWGTGFLSREKGIRTFGLLITIISIVSLILYFLLNSRSQSQMAAFYLLPARFWELGAGCLAFVLMEGFSLTIRKWFKPAGSLLILVALVALLFVSVEYASYNTFLVVILTVILILSLAPETKGWLILSDARAVYVGRISYSLYLWHWPIISLSLWTTGLHWWLIPIQTMLIWGLADFSYRYIEYPLRHATWTNSGLTTIAVGGCVSAAVVVILAIIGKPLRGHLYTGNVPVLIARNVSSLSDSYTMPQGRWQWQGEKCVISSNEQVGKIILIRECTLGDFETAAHRVLVVGNSFSAAFVQAFDDMVYQDGFAVTITSAWGASVVPEVANETAWVKANNYYWSTVVPQLVSNLRKGDLVFLVNDMADFSPSTQSVHSADNLNSLRVGLSNFSDQLSKLGIRLAILHGNPFARDANCHPDSAGPQWFAPFGSPCKYFTKAETLERRRPLDTALRDLEIV